MSAQHETEGQLPQGEFPASKSKSLGQFWLPVSPDSRISGLLEIDDTTVRLEVSPELTPWYVRTPQAGGGYAISRAPETGEVVILGSLTARPTEVSVWRAVTTGRNAVGFPMASAGRPSTQVLDGLWCVAGGHFADSASKWFGVRPDVTNLSSGPGYPALRNLFFSALGWTDDFVGILTCRTDSTRSCLTGRATSCSIRQPASVQRPFVVST